MLSELQRLQLLEKYIFWSLPLTYTIIDDQNTFDYCYIWADKLYAYHISKKYLRIVSAIFSFMISSVFLFVFLCFFSLILLFEIAFQYVVSLNNLGYKGSNMNVPISSYFFSRTLISINKATSYTLPMPHQERLKYWLIIAPIKLSILRIFSTTVP